MGNNNNKINVHLGIKLNDTWLPKNLGFKTEKKIICK